MAVSGPCPCDSGRPYAHCCGAFIAGAGAGAETPEALMRSRYSAYVLGEQTYLLDTWHPSTRPESIDTAAGPRWLRLEIRSTGGGPADDEGTVEFVAHYLEGEHHGRLHELSRFRREEGRWYYLDGTLYPTDSEKVGRNAACPCGSGRKFKRCCGR